MPFKRAADKRYAGNGQPAFRAGNRKAAADTAGFGSCAKLLQTAGNAGFSFRVGKLIFFIPQISQDFLTVRRDHRSISPRVLTIPAATSGLFMV